MTVVLNHAWIERVHTGRTIDDKDPSRLTVRLEIPVDRFLAEDLKSLLLMQGHHVTATLVEIEPQKDNYTLIRKDQ